MSDVQMSRLINEPGGPEWRHPTLAKYLEMALPGIYEAYISTITEMNETLEKLKMDLDIFKSDSVSAFLK
jgi:hypothetical protein